ncbi:MAG: HDOD domain-containing protein [Vampirovibrionia bacterium]
MKVVGYICSSIGSKTDKSLELKIQREQIEKYCFEHELELLRFYSDTPDKDNKDKPALKQLIRESRSNQFDRVLVLKFNRISYEKVIKLWVYDELSKSSVDLYSVSENEFLSDPYQEDVQEKINMVLRKVKDIPSLPEVVTKIMELVSNPTSSAAELSQVIAHDPGLTTRVLRLVNSAYYGFPKQISSVQQAIMILGFTTMRGLVLSTSIFKIFTPKDSKTGRTIDYKQFWKHSISTALCARVIAEKIKMPEIGDAFSCGILHDIGKVVLDQYDHSDYVEVFKLLKPKYTSDQLLEAEEHVIGINHANIGYRVADKWNLPMNLSETIRCHHKPMGSMSHMRMVSVIYVANKFANIIEKPYIMFNIDDFDTEVLEYLNIDKDFLKQIFDFCKEEVDKGSQLDSFFE